MYRISKQTMSIGLSFALALSSLVMFIETPLEDFSQPTEITNYFNKKEGKIFQCLTKKDETIPFNGIK